MVVPVKVYADDIINQYDVSAEKAIEAIDYIIKSITARFAEKWSEEATLELKGTRKVYLDNLKVIDEGRMSGAVVLDYTKNSLVPMIEEGHEPFDMKEGFSNSSKKKIVKRKNGNTGWYLTIPFSIGTPGTLKDTVNFSSIMPDEIYTEVKKLGSNKSLVDDNIPQEFNVLKTRAFIEATPKSKAFEEYKHKSNIYSGITKTTDKVTGQNSYVSFRRVSDLSDGLAFIHPGMRKHDLAGKAFSKFESNMQNELTQITDNALAHLGIV